MKRLLLMLLFAMILLSIVSACAENTFSCPVCGSSNGGWVYLD